MSITAAILLIISAATHAGWNFISKKEHPTQAFYLTYGLVLISMNYVNSVSYVAAFRQLSIPLGALFGMALLKEPRYNPKIIGVTMIFLGLVMVGLG